MNSPSQYITSRFLLGAGGVLLAWLWVYAETLQHMVQVWAASEAYKHCFFIPLISAYLIYEKRFALARTTIQFRPEVLILLFLGQLAFIVSAALDINLLMHTAAVCSLIVIIWSLIGHQAARVLMFPLLYLLFSIPFGEELVPWLQDVTAWISVSMLQLFGIPVYREGLYIFIPNGTFLVAEACAGIRFLIGTFAIGTLLAYLNYQKYWKRSLFILLCAVIPILANGIRAFGIIIIGYLTDMEHATGADHLVYGWFFFAFVMIILFWLGTFGVDNVEKEETNASLTSAMPTLSLLKLGLLILVLIAPYAASNYWLYGTGATSVSVKDPAPSILSARIESSELSWSMPTDEIIWTGRVNNVPVRLLYVNEDVHGRELVSGRHRLFNEKFWSPVRSYREDTDGRELQFAEIVNTTGERKRLVSWYQVGEKQTANSLKMKVHQLMARLAHEPADGYFIVAEIPEGRSLESLLTLFAPLTHIADSNGVHDG
nr:exosortase A [Aestuariibacter salexigens]